MHAFRVSSCWRYHANSSAKVWKRPVEVRAQELVRNRSRSCWVQARSGGFGCSCLASHKLSKGKKQ